MGKEAEVGGKRPQPSNAQDGRGPQELGDRREGVALGHLDLRRWPPGLERINSCCFEPPALWSHVPVTPGH